MPHVDDGIGWKGTDTSRGAARTMVPSAAIIRTRVLACLRASPIPLTADEITECLGLDPFTVRPRISELRNDGKIRDSGQRRPGHRGRSQAAWEVPQKKRT